MSQQLRVKLPATTRRKTAGSSRSRHNDKPILRQWSQQDMNDAYNDVVGGYMNISKAARTYNVPRKTLSDRVHNNVSLDAQMGAPTALSTEEETSLVKYVEYMAGRGFPLTVDQLCSFAFAIAKSAGKSDVFSESGPSQMWWRGFKNRHPNIRLRRPDILDRGRSAMTNVTVLSEYFELLDQVLTKEGLKDKPHLLYNCDETAIDLNKSTQRVLVPVKQKHSHLRSLGATQHISVHCCVNAAGHALPPFIIFSGGFPGGEYTKDGPDQAVYATSQSGFMDSELYIKWFEKVFLAHTPGETRLLLQDGHSSHINIDLIDKALSNNVILMCLPPHTTHILQPLDVAVYKSLKCSISKHLSSIRIFKSDVWVSKRNFASVFKEPFEHSLCLKNIKEGFRKCGIYPFDPNAVDKDLISVSQKVPSDVDLSEPARKRVKQPGSTSQDIDQSNVTPSTSKDNPSPEYILQTPTSTKFANPLVDAGLISPRMARVLTPPDEPVKKSTRRIVTKARVLTSDEVAAEIREKDRKSREET